MTKEEILAKAKKDYPIGTVYKLAHKPEIIHTITGDLKWGVENNIYGVNSIEGKGHDGCVYFKGDWAEIISKPEQQFTEGQECEECCGEGRIMKAKLYPSGHTEVWEDCHICNGEGVIDKIQTNIMEEKKTEFKKGDYIVITRPESEDTAYLKCNYCFINSGEYEYFHTRTDCKGFSTGQSKIHYKSGLWRYATKEEIDEYDRIGKPYDVTTLKPIKEWSVGSYAVALKDDAYSIEGCSKGDIFIKLDEYDWAFYNNQINDNWDCESLDNFKWFPALQEAEIFSKSLLNNNFANVLKEFPSEGCVYENISQLDSLVNYLLNRPLNKADGKIQKSEAIGIAWNKTSCWWLKTNKSEKPLFKLTDLKDFLPKENNNFIPEYVKFVSKEQESYRIPQRVYKVVEETIKNSELIVICNLECDRYIPGDQLYISHSSKSEDWVISTKSEYLKQQYPLTKEEYYSSEIEIGDEIETNCGNTFPTRGKKVTGVVIKIDKDYNTQPCYYLKFKDDPNVWCYPDENYIKNPYFKLIKKASQTAIAKKVDVSLPKVGNKLLLFKKRESTTLPNVERTKLKIFKQKLIKI